MRKILCMSEALIQPMRIWLCTVSIRISIAVPPAIMFIGIKEMFIIKFARKRIVNRFYYPRRFALFRLG